MEPLPSNACCTTAVQHAFEVCVRAHVHSSECTQVRELLLSLADKMEVLCSEADTRSRILSNLVEAVEPAEFDPRQDVL